MLFGLYRGFTTLFGPLAPLALARRETRGKEDPDRRGERLGHASAPRPEGKLVWIHAASVGEAISGQILIDRLLAAHAGLQILLTTGTVSSARLLATRLPPAARHQFIPIDRPDCVERFLDHWRPDCAIWLESELWPNLLHGVGRRGIPAILANARLSERSFARWSWAPAFARRLIGTFELVLPGDRKSAERYAAFGARMGPTGNLKYSAQVLPGDEAAQQALHAALAGRPFWLAASTHPGEEEQVLAAHRAMRERHPGLLTILAPRHPPRGPDVARLIDEAGLKASIRSAGQQPGADTDIHLMDTLGEMGMLYRLAPLVFLGNSLSAQGGHNPLEPAKLDCAILTGPNTANFSDIFGAMEKEKAVLIVRDASDLARVAGDLLTDGAGRAALAGAAARFADERSAVIDRALEAMAPILEKAGLGP